MRKVVGSALVVLAAVWMLYLVAANVILATSIGPALASSDRVDVRWRSGWSLWPTRFELRGAQIDARGPLQPLRAQADEVDGAVSLRELLSGRISVDDLEAIGVRHIRAGALTYDGDASVRGAFVVDRSGDVRIDHASVATPSGFVRLEQAPLLDDVRAYLVVDRELTPGKTNGGLELRASIASGSFLRRFTTDAADTRGYLRASLRVVDGALAPLSTAELRTEPSRASVVLGVDEHGAATLTALVHDAARERSDATGIAARVAEVRANIQTARVWIAAPLEDAAGTVDLRGLEIDGSRIPLVGDILRERPLLRGDAKFEIAHGVASGRADVSTEDAVIAHGDAERRGRLRVHVDLRGLDFGAREARIDAIAEHASDRGDGSIIVEDALLSDALPGKPRTFHLDGAVRVRTSDGSFVVDALNGERKLPGTVAEVLATHPLDARGRAHVDGDAFVIDGIEGRAGPVGLRGRLERPRAGAPAMTTLLFELGPSPVGVVMHGRQMTVVQDDAPAWFEREIDRSAGRSGS